MGETFGVPVPSESGVVGRGPELEVIRAFVSHPPARPACLAIVGEAGIGKTTLWQAALREAARVEAFVLQCNPTEPERSLPFAALTSLLAPIQTEILPTLPAPQRFALEIELLLREPSGPPPGTHAVGLGLSGCLRELASRRSLLLAIDDFQWIDGASRAVLIFAFRRLRCEPVRVLLTERIEPAQPETIDLDRVFAQWDVKRIDVGPLSLGAMHHFLHQRQGTVFSRLAMREIHGMSGGNAFYALESARAAAAGSLPVGRRETLPIPPSLSQLLASRLAKLPTETVDALRLAAGLSYPNRLVLLACGTKSEDLAPAVSANLVRLDDDVLSFTHPLIASCVYASADALTLRAVHRRLAGAVSDPMERVRHLALASAGPEPGIARQLELASNRARARGAVAIAAELADKALRLTPQTNVKGRWRRALQAGRFLFGAGDIVQSETVLETALQWVQRGPGRASVLVLLGRITMYEGDQVLAADLFREAAVMAGVDREVRARAAIGIASSLTFRLTDLNGSAAFAGEAARLFRQLGNKTAVADALATQGVAETLLGRRGARRRCESALAVSTGNDAVQAIQRPPYMMSVHFLWTDRLVEAKDLLRVEVQHAGDQGDDASLPLLLGRLSLVEFLIGDWAAASRHADEGYDVALQTGQRPQQGFVMAVSALIMACRGQLEASINTAQSALERVGDRGGAQARVLALWALALGDLSTGNPSGAADHLLPVLRQARGAGVREPGANRFVPDLVEALIALDRVDEARESLEWFESAAVSLNRSSGKAGAARCRGLLEAASGKLEAAARALEVALTEHERALVPFERARTLLVLGAIYRRSRQLRSARRSLEDAGQVFGQLGAVLWAERAHAELARVGGRKPSDGTLSATELRVASLVTAGHSNRESANVLFVTERTVESNLTRIYAKLGLRSRTQLAAAVQGHSDQHLLVRPGPLR